MSPNMALPFAGTKTILRWCGCSLSGARIQGYGGVRFGGTLTTGKRFRARLRSRRTMHGGRAVQRSSTMKNGLAAGRTPGIGFSDGAAAHWARHEADSLANTSGAAPDRGHRRWPYRNRLRNRSPRLLSGAGREVPGALRNICEPRPVRCHSARIIRRKTARSRKSLLRMAAHCGPSGAAAKRERRSPRIGELLRSWGGATIVYRRRLVDAPSYAPQSRRGRKGHEEGIRFAESLTPTEVELDDFGMRSPCGIA